MRLESSVRWRAAARDGESSSCTSGVYIVIRSGGKIRALSVPYPCPRAHTILWSGVENDTELADVCLPAVVRLLVPVLVTAHRVGAYGRVWACVGVVWRVGGGGAEGGEGTASL